MHAFIEKEECSKEEKTCGQNREITKVSQFALRWFLTLIYYAVNLFRKRKIPAAGLQNCADVAAVGLEFSYM